MISDQIARKLQTSSLPRSLGIRVLRALPGDSTLEVTVVSEHLNLHGACHGGLIFTLADTAFGFAANAGEENAVTQEASIHYVTAARLDEVLTARATQTSRQGRSAVLDVTVTADDGRVVALFRGLARFIA